MAAGQGEHDFFGEGGDGRGLTFGSGGSFCFGMIVRFTRGAGLGGWFRRRDEVFGI